MAPKETLKRKRRRPSSAVLATLSTNDEDELLSPEKSTSQSRQSKAYAKRVQTATHNTDVEDELLSPEYSSPKTQVRKAKTERVQITVYDGDGEKDLRPPKQPKPIEKDRSSNVGDQKQAQQTDETRPDSADDLELQPREQERRRKRGRHSNLNPLEQAEDVGLREEPKKDLPNRRNRGEPRSTRHAGGTARAEELSARMRQSQHVEEAESQPEEPLKKSRKIRHDVDPADEEELEDNAAPKYQHLAVVQRNIPRHTIDAKWNPLPKVAVERIGQLFQDAERSVVMRIPNDGKRSQASTALNMVVHKITRKLHKLPFPPSMKQQREDDFDLEKIVDSTRLLEARLTPAQHSIELLKTELRKQESLCEAEMAEKENLESNAKADVSRKAQATRKLHSVLRHNTQSQLGNDGLLENLAAKYYPVFQPDNIPDEELKTVIEELRHHLESMKSNISQVQGLSSAMARSRAAVQDVLFKHLHTERYEQVVLG